MKLNVPCQCIQGYQSSVGLSSGAVHGCPLNLPELKVENLTQFSLTRDTAILFRFLNPPNGISSPLPDQNQVPHPLRHAWSPFALLIHPFPPVDVAIHCGDLTDGSKLAEFRSTLLVLKQLPAPLKLVIAGNHDFTLDEAAFRVKVAEAERAASETGGIESALREYGHYGEARQLFESDEARDAGIRFLDEGIHAFTLANGARLTVFASPFTPAPNDWASGHNWAFQYPLSTGHDWSDLGDRPADVDVFITHGPPHGILDRSDGRRLGCAGLFAAVATAMPLLHCFGHVHSGWGGRLVAWRERRQESHTEERLLPTHFDAVDNERSRWLDRLADFVEGMGGGEAKGSLGEDSLESLREVVRVREDSAGNPACIESDPEPVKRWPAYRKQRYAWTCHCGGDAHLAEKGKHTLFINAAIQGVGVELSWQLPWIVELDLPRKA